MCKFSQINSELIPMIPPPLPPPSSLSAPEKPYHPQPPAVERKREKET